MLMVICLAYENLGRTRSCKKYENALHVVEAAADPQRAFADMWVVHACAEIATYKASDATRCAFRAKPGLLDRLLNAQAGCVESAQAGPQADHKPCTTKGRQCWCDKQIGRAHV